MKKSPSETLKESPEETRGTTVPVLSQEAAAEAEAAAAAAAEGVRKRKESAAQEVRTVAAEGVKKREKSAAQEARTVAAAREVTSGQNRKRWGRLDAPSFHGKHPLFKQN